MKGDANQAYILLSKPNGVKYLTLSVAGGVENSV
jgi:hypothetical protein